MYNAFNRIDIHIDNSHTHSEALLATDDLEGTYTHKLNFFKVWNENCKNTAFVI